MKRIARKTALMFLTAMLLLPAARAQESENTALKIQSKAYVSLVRADQARDEKDWNSALPLYREALKSYRQLATTHPSWQPDIVEYRSSYCANQIKKIQGVVAPKKKPAAAENEEDTYKARYNALMKENQYLHRRISEVEAAAGEKTDDESGADLTIAQLEADVAALENELRVTRQEVARSGKQNSIELQKQNARLKEDLAQMQAKNASDSETLGQLQQQIAQLTQSLTESQNAQKSLQRSLDVTQKRLGSVEELEARATEAQRKAEDGDKEVKDARRQIKSLEKSAADHMEEAEQLQKKLAQLEQETRDLRAANKESAAAADSLKSFKKEKDALLKDLAAVEEKLNDAVSTADSLHKELKAATDARATLEKELQKKKEDLTAETRQTVEQLTSENKDLTQEISAAREESRLLAEQIAERDREIAEARKANDTSDLKKELAQTEKNLTEAEKERDKLAAQIADLEKQAQERDSDSASGLKAELKQLRRDIKDAVKERDEFEKIAANAVKTSRDLDAAAIELSAEVASLRDQLASATKGDMAAALKENGALKAELARTKDESKSLSAKLRGAEAELKKSVEEIGDLRGENEKLARKTAELAEEVSAVRELKKENKALAKQLASLQKDLKDYEDALRGAKLENDDLRKAASTFEANAEEWRKQAESKGPSPEAEKVKELTKVNGRLEKDVKDLSARLATSSEEAESLRAEKARIGDELKKTAGRLDELEQTVAEQAKGLREIGDAKAMVVTLQQQLKSAEEEVERSREFLEKYDDLLAQNRALSSQVQDMQDQQVAYRQERDDAIKKAGKWVKKNDELKAQVREVQEELHRLEQLVRFMQNEYSKGK
ncbi:MAG: hypothetical protein KJ626_10675 [Verrucomicrobia bacterium]|nr:hypothetical protein [Verrucomicrobiota bacterium]